MKPSLAIVISAYNQAELLIKCIESVKTKTNYRNYQIFLVDDSGKGKIGKLIAKKFKFVDITINKKNLGFSGAYNVGVKKSIRK